MTPGTQFIAAPPVDTEYEQKDSNLSESLWKNSQCRQPKTRRKLKGKKSHLQHFCDAAFDFKKFYLHNIITSDYKLRNKIAKISLFAKLVCLEQADR
jgi:hypothetical protein